MRNGYLLILSAWLITLSFLVNNYWWFISSPSHVQNLLEQNIQNREKEFGSLVSDTALMYKLLNRDYDADFLKNYTGNNEDFYLFFFNNDWNTFWTTNQIAVDSAVFNLPEGRYFKKLKSGYYEIIRKDLDSKNYVFGFIPVKKEYYFSNRYLPEKFYQLSRIGSSYKLNKKGKGLPVRSISGSILFYVQNVSARGLAQKPWLSGILLALAIVCINLFLNQLALYIGKNSKTWIGFVFLCVAFFVLRGLNYFDVFSLGFESYNLFDSTIYASSLILKSLGDLLINVILIGWLILYAYNRLRPTIHIPNNLSRIKRYLFMFLGNIFIFYVAYYAVVLIRGLVINSQISFDVTDFFSLNIYSFIGFVILGLLGFSFFFLCPIFNRIQLQLSNNKLLEKYIILGISGFLWLVVQLYVGGYLYVFWIMIWVIGYLYLMDLTDHWLQNKYNLERFILWLLVLTVSITTIIIFYNRQREMNYRKQLVIKLTKQKDPTLIFNLSLKDSAIVKDVRVTSYFKNIKKSNKHLLETYLLNQYFSNLRNSYDFQFYTFLPSDSIMSQRQKTEKSNAENLVSGSMFTDFENIYFKQSDISDYYYVGALPIQVHQSDSLLGFLYYSMQPKVVKPESLYPELLIQREDYNYRNALKKYSYAVYDHRKLVYHRNGFPFPLRLSLSEIPDRGFNHADRGDYSVLRYKASDNKVIVMVKQSKEWLEAMTLFAYLFCIFLLLVLLFNIFRILLKSRLRLGAMMDLTRLNIRNRVYTIIVFIVIFVFVILGYSTIQFFVKRYEVQHKERLDREINALLSRIQSEFYPVSNNNPDVYFYNFKFDQVLKHKIQEIAVQERIDINIYDLDGHLRISTQNMIYNNGLLSRKMDPSAYYSLQFLHQVQVTQKEQVGNLNFLSAYVPIRGKNGQTLAYLNLPNFASQSNLKLEISNFLMTLINLNAFVFLLAGLLALLFTHSITRSFTLIIEKLKNVKLTGKNETITWEYDDEIGSLVTEYNKMVHKLEESAEKLAQAEREGAWQKMARQVAHEIKNPLTPMKLSLQHLQYAIRNDSPRKDQLTQDVAQTIIEQIDHLTQIASDFSAFANITYARKEKFVLNDVLASVVSLHHGYEHIDIDYEVPSKTFEVEADKTQINRVFTNLVQNAMQAIPDNVKGVIRVRMIAEDNAVVVQVSDDGDGIQEEMREQIFMPNFTTKSSGTGLGLAICKNIILQHRGAIWFETEVGKGTTFCVRLPLS